MEIRRDKNGKPVGLQWPDRPPVDRKIMIKHIKHDGQFKTGHEPLYTGSEPHEYCGKGLHLMSEHSKPVKNGTGRYCVPCKNLRQRKNNKAWKDRQRAKVQEEASRDRGSSVN